jgi:hypothetical protein
MFPEGKLFTKGGPGPAGLIGDETISVKEMTLVAVKLQRPRLDQEYERRAAATTGQFVSLVVARGTHGVKTS